MKTSYYVTKESVLRSYHMTLGHLDLNPSSKYGWVSTLYDRVISSILVFKDRVMCLDLNGFMQKKPQSHNMYYLLIVYENLNS